MKYSLKSVIALMLCTVMLFATALTGCDMNNADDKENGQESSQSIPDDNGGSDSEDNNTDDENTDNTDGGESDDTGDSGDISEPTYSEGLKFEPTSDGKGYVLVSAETCTDINVKIPSMYEGKPVTAIADNAFRGRTTLTDIEIPNGIVSIGAGAFEGCIALKEIELPDSVTEIGSGAFKGCVVLVVIVLSKKVTAIPESAFEGCSSLKK